MKLSYIDLDNRDSVWIDEGARSLAYFCKKLPASVDKKLLEKLKKIASTFNDKNLRLCLHDTPQALFQNMIILERKGLYYRPHKHLKKGESFHIIEGKMAIFTFADTGKVIDSCIMELGGNIIYRVPVDTYHAIIPMTDFIIYHESNLGPFLGKASSIFPEWSPEEDDEEGINRYRGMLLTILKEIESGS